MPGHLALWSPPIFYPVPNTAAYTDILLGVAPLYWPWRVVGFAPDTSYQLWMLTVVSFNYVAAVVCCRRLLKVGWPAAAVGSFVFAFGSSRIAQIGRYRRQAARSRRPLASAPGDENCAHARVAASRALLPRYRVPVYLATLSSNSE